MTISRRRFLKILGATGGGSLLAGCEPAPAPVAAVPSGWDRGEERFVASTCQQCPAGCGVRVRLREGFALKIEGIAEHPLNQGGLGPKGQCGLDVLYHPDRVRGPLRREGPRGSGRWQQISWDAAIAEVAAKLGEQRKAGDPRSAVVVDGEPRGIMRGLWQRFADAFGTPNHVDHRSMTVGGKVLAMTYMHGVPEIPAYDWSGTRYVLAFGASLFESWCQTIHFTRGVERARRGTPGRHAKLVVVAPRLSLTAVKADEWVPIVPGTYGALALGLAHVLVKESLHDAAFVAARTFGFEAWKDAQGRAHRGFRDLVLEGYAPAKVAAVTGISAETIVRLAHELAENRPTLAVADGGAAAATNGLGTAMAIHALNALIGNLERPGGMLTQDEAPLAPWKAVAQDEVAREGCRAPRADGVGTASCPLGLSNVQALPDAILSGSPYPVKSLLLYRSNPVFSKPAGRRWAEAIQKVPFVVSFSPLPDESTFYADYVLPDHTYLERWELVEPVPNVGYPVLGVRQPVVPPVHDTLATGDVLIRLAKAIGGSVAEAFPWASLRDASLERLHGVVAAKKGSIVADKPESFVAKLEQNGFWAAPGYAFERWEKAFKTPSGKFEFYSQTIASKLAAVFPNPADLEKHLAARGVATRGDDLCMPHWEPPRFEGDPERYPLVVVGYRGIEYAEGGARHVARLRELPAAGRLSWSERVELSAKDAEHLGIKDDQVVIVETSAGRRKLRAQVSEGIRPGTLGLRLGGGVWPPRPADAETPGGYGLFASTADPLAGIFALQGTRAVVRKDGV